MARLLALILLAPLVPAQGPARPDPRAFGVPEAGAAARALARGRELAQAGRTAEAREHLDAALLRHPHAALLLFERAELGPLPERPPWVLRGLGALVNAGGRLALDSGERRLLRPEDRPLEVLTQARAAAAIEIQQVLTRLAAERPDLPAEVLVVAWLGDLAQELVRDLPRMAAPLADALAAAMRRLEPRPAAFLRVLESWLAKAEARGDPEMVQAVARRILGLAAQAGFSDLRGERPPGFPGLQAKAAAALSRARSELERKAGPPIEFGALQALDAPEREAFTRAHEDPARPGRAFSPNRRYVVETTLGYATLLGAAETVELHHERLARWFGRDPFVAEPGLIRIVPEACELESEGVPHWWAGGFQRGAVTTVLFQTGTIEGLGRTLTHELTHRFDAACFAGLPAWLVEGKAVWTAGAYAGSGARDFVENHASFGSIERAFLRGYGDPRNLERLILGFIEDYRDNYTAGYALYVYLRLWAEAEGHPLFAGRLLEFQRGYTRGAARPLDWFAAHFADAKDGRPAGLAAFASGFGEFLRGFYWDSRAPWTTRFVEDLRGPRGPYVYDQQAWTRARTRAEPIFGQDQLGLAMAQGAQLEDPAGAALLGLGAFRRDELPLAEHGELCRVLETAGHAGAAWALGRHRAHRGGPPLSGPSPWSARLPRVHALAPAYEAAIAALPAEAALARAALAARRARLATLTGADPRPPAAVMRPASLPDEPALLLELFGYEEDRLTGYEERLVPGLWHAEPDGDLHVGRARPREGTGSLDPRAHQRDVFVRSKLHLAPGRYRLRTRIHLTTSFVSGAVVVGHTRHDRQVRIGFRAGDLLFAIGKKEERTEVASVSIQLSGQRVRDEHVASARPHATIRFPHPRSSFDLTVLVEGGMVQAWIDDQPAGTYHSLDGLAVEGAIGFAAGHGAYRVEDPRVDRRDAESYWRAAPCESLPVDLQDSRLGDPAQLQHHRALALAGSPAGTLLVLAPPADPRDSEIGLEPEGPRALLDAASLLKKEGSPAVLVLAVPDASPEALAAYAEALAAAPARLLTHAIPLGEKGPRLLYLDPHGVVRHVGPVPGAGLQPDRALRHLLAVFRHRRAG